MRWALIAVLLLSGCRFREPEPSKEVYYAAVVDMPKRPGIDVKATKPTPGPLPTDDAAVAPVVGDAKDGAMEVRSFPARSMLCARWSKAGVEGASLEGLGTVVRSLSDRAEARADESAGVILEPLRVCLVLTGPMPGAEPLPARRVAVLWHRGDYGKVSARRGALEAWAAQEGHTPAGPPRIFLYVDPETAKTPNDLIASLEVPLKD